MGGFNIGELADRADVHIETLRYYERRGLVRKPPRSPSNYRRYPEETLRRVRFVRRARQLGFSLQEIGDLLALRSKPGAQAKEVRERAQTKLAEIDDKIRSLRGIRRALTKLVTGCSGRGPATNCTILEALDGETEL